MNMQPVQSSKIQAIGYDQTFYTLRIQIHGETHDYHDVPTYIYENLMRAFSKSRYYDGFIKDSYRYSLIVQEREYSYQN